MVIKMRYIFYILGGRGGFCPPFVHVDKGGRVVKCPRLSTRGGEEVKIGQNLVHVVVEWPLSKYGFPFLKQNLFLAQILV